MASNGDVITLIVFVAGAVVMGGAFLYLGLKSGDREDGSD